MKKKPSCDISKEKQKEAVMELSQFKDKIDLLPVDQKEGDIAITGEV